MRIYEDQLIVITGGAGFIGSCLVRYLNNKGLNNIIIADNLGKTEKWKNLLGKSFIDIVEKENFFQWLEGRESSIEAFIHLGACTDTLEKDASYLLENNYQFSVRLAEYAIKNEHRFIYASSAATYGNGTLGFSDNHDLLPSFSPMNMYGYSKHLFDLWLLNQGLLDKVTGLKFFNVFGPNEYHKGRMASVITHFLPLAQKEGCIRLFKSNQPEQFADGEQKRDFIYVKDVVKMIAAFLENDSTGIYNIGTGTATSWNQIAEAVFKAINKPTKIEYIAMPEDLNKQYQNYTVADIKKIKSCLKDNSYCTSIEDAVIEYIQHYLLSGQRW